MGEAVLHNDFIKSVNNGCSCVLKKLSKEDSSLIFDAESSINLNQKPQEALKVRVCISNRDDVQREVEKYAHRCTVALNFSNNLHQVSQNYIYEVNLKLFICHDLHFYHVDCLTRRQVRVDSTITFCEPKLCVYRILPMFSSAKVTSQNAIFHVCIDVRRFEKFGWIKNIHVSNHTDVGTMLLRNSTYSDVSLVVGNSIFPAHKLILSKKSVVFEAMFAHTMSENQSGLVRIDNFDAKVIDEVLTYIYTGKADNLSQMPIELFKAAHLYELSELKDMCEEYMLFNIDVTNVVDLLQLSNLYDLKAMKKFVNKFIDIHEDELIKQEGFLQFLHNDLTVDRAAYTLQLCVKHGLTDLQLKVFDFIKDKQHILDVQGFIHLFISHPTLMHNLIEHIMQ